MPNTVSRTLSTFEGFVVRGNQLGRTIGYPTANLDIQSACFPSLNGVYSVYVTYNQQHYKGIMNIGYKPTIEQEKPKKTFEVFIFDFNEDIYGEKLGVEIISFIRNEKKFKSLEELKAQLKKDCQIAKSHFEESKITISNFTMHIQHNVIHLPDLDFARHCETKYGINRGVYNTIDKWFSDNGSTEIVGRRKRILYFLHWVTAYTSKEKLKFGNKGLSEQLERFSTESIY
ncbi:riboflavin kinase [Lysinibacillus endophyticus]|uniref:riboflavin kinase n=1 Tax=Ureibacillus endophyticus TaxID=1978490 RepID=UPI0031351801